MRSRSRHVFALVAVCGMLLALAPSAPLLAPTALAQADATPPEVDPADAGAFELVPESGDGGQPGGLTREAVFAGERFLFDRMVPIDPGSLTDIGQSGDVVAFAAGDSPPFDAIYLQDPGESDLARYLPEQLDALDSSCPADAANIGRLDTGDAVYVFAGVESDLTPDDLEQVGTDQSNQPVYADPGAAQPYPELFFTDQAGLLRFVQAEGDGQPATLGSTLAFDGATFDLAGDVTESVNPADLTQLGCAGAFPVFEGPDAGDPGEASRYVRAGGRLYQFTGELAATEEATEEPTEEPTEGPTEEPTEEAGLPSVFVVDLQDEDGNAIGGACWQLIQDGNVVQEDCDTEEAGDTDPLNGRTGFDSVPAGDYILHQSTVPENANPADDVEFTIPGDGADVEQFVVVPVFAQQTEEPTEEPTEQPTEEPTEQPTEEVVETEAPTEQPTEEFIETEEPTEQPTEQPTEEIIDTEEPTEEIAETEEPTEQLAETEEPTEQPPETEVATEAPPDDPIVIVTGVPTQQPTATAIPTQEPTATTNPDASPTPRPTEQLQAPAIIPTLAANVPQPPAVTAEPVTTCPGNPGAIGANGLPANLPIRIQRGGVAYSLAGAQAPDEAGTLTTIGCIGPFEVATTDQADASAVLYLRYTGTGEASEQVYRFEAATTFGVEFEVTGRAQVIQAADQQFRLTQIWQPSVYSSVTVILFVNDPEAALPETVYGVSVANNAVGEVIGEYTAAEANAQPTDAMVDAGQQAGLNPDLTVAGQHYLLSNVYLPVGTTTNGFVTLYAANGDVNADRLLGRDLRRLELFIYNSTGGD